MAQATKQLQAQAKTQGPKDDDELHHWIKSSLGMNIPRIAVCDGHSSPFEFISDIYFERVTSAIAMASRGGSKTMSSAIIHLLNSLYKPRCQSISVGAQLAQADRVYENLKILLKIHGKVDDVDKHPMIARSIQQITQFVNDAKVEILPGCFPAHTKIITKEGLKTIGEIVRNKLNIEVQSYNFKEEKFEWQKVTDWHYNGQSEQWLKFKFEFSTLQGPNDIYCTPGHKLLTINGKKKNAYKFKVGDSVCVKAQIMSDEQEQISIGMMLGDGHLDKNCRYRVSHAYHQENYLRWFEDAFKEYNVYWSRRESKNTFSADVNKSRVFSEMRKNWYPEGIKRIPDRIWGKLDKLGLACWLMDDGCWIPYNGKQWMIAAMNFNKNERQKTQEFFDNIGIDGHWICVEKEKDQWIWRTIGDGGIALQSIVSEYIDVSEKQTKGYKKWIATPIIEHSNLGVMKSIIKSIEKSTIKQGKFDITVPPNANYVTSSGAVVSNTISAVNGPHAPKVHTDEVDIMDYGVYLESRNISQSLSYFVDGPNGEQIEMTIIAQDWITSTRKSASGLMQKLINDIEESERQGYKPAYKLYTWCFVESAKAVSNCQVAFPDIPKEMDCGCDKVVNDKWDDGTPRLFVDICKGRLSKPDGFTPITDIHKRFEANDRNTWEAQQECSKPETGGMVFKAFDRTRMAIKWWEPRPEFGMIVQGVDFSGGTNPAAVEWVQILNRDVRWWGADQAKTDYPNRLVKAGTKIIFDEIYKAEVGNMEIASMVIDREKGWRKIYPEFDVQFRFVDPSNQDNRRDWHAIGLKTHFFCTRSIPEQCRTVNDLIKEDLLLFDSTRCIMLPLEMNAYHYPDSRVGMEYNKETPVDDYNHTVSAIRYTIENLKVIDRKGLSKVGLPMSSGGHYTSKSPIKHSAPRYLPSSMLKGP